MELIFATNNEHKAGEVRAMIPEGIILKSLADIGCEEDIAETADTFAGNASLKSTYVYRNYGKNCFGDDSGLEIDALDGEPGVFSARYSGSRDSEKNIQLVLDRLASSDNRKARFKTVISLILQGTEYQFEGVVEGEIIRERTGHQGFGYDPIFKPDGHSITFAEMDLQEKNKISHRAQAFQKMIAFLKQQQG